MGAGAVHWPRSQVRPPAPALLLGLPGGPSACVPPPTLSKSEGVTSSFPNSDQSGIVDLSIKFLTFTLWVGRDTCCMDPAPPAEAEWPPGPSQPASALSRRGGATASRQSSGSGGLASSLPLVRWGKEQRRPGRAGGRAEVPCLVSELEGTRTHANPDALRGFQESPCPCPPP